MALSPRLAWVVLPYFAVLFGMMFLRSAWGALIGFHLALFPLLLPRRKRTHPLFRPVSWQILLPVALAGLAAGLGLWLVWPWTGMPADYPARVQALGLQGFIWLPFVIYFTLVNPFLEEIYWRGDLGSDARLPRLVDFLFAGYHVIILALFAAPFWVLAGFLILSATSWLWRQISRYTDSLLPAALFHMLADFSLLVVLYLKAM